MNTKLVQLPNSNWVNPSHVTSIHVEDHIKLQKTASVTVWCVMNALHGTGAIYYKSFPSLSEAKDHAEEMAILING